MHVTEALSPPDQAARLAVWLRLTLTPGVGRLTAARLLAHFSTPHAIFSATPAALGQIVSARKAALLLAAPGEAVCAQIARTLDWASHSGRHLLALDDPRYPALLRQIPDPPPLLYAIGRTELLQGPALAVVGSRNASTQGLANAAAFAHALSAAGITIVSGLALGIDSAAHQGALRALGATVAVIGTGADRIYPSRNRSLAHQIAEQGCIISEYALGTAPQAANFPRRNRLISGLCCAVLVVEAAAQSGSLITAHVAADQGRDVFAIPGSIHAPLSKGCHKLIKEGAKLVESAADVLLELRFAPLLEGVVGTPRAYQGEHQAVLLALGQGPVDTDTLAAHTRLGAAALSGALLALELAGHAERLPGGLFQRINP
ncbi:MAG: DNA-processing protein DprA [Pseudomonadota bacterium]